jgi:molybdenum cofactor synthesis domain-containing protein
MNRNAAVIIVGNEILSGRTREANAYFLAKQCSMLGIRLKRVCVIPDEVDTIVAAVNALRAEWDYVIVCGGIGPTPDDVTRPAVAKAFGVPCEPHAEAVALLQHHYGERSTPRRMVMAELPRAAELIDNPVTIAPGFRLENVFVLPGIPELVEAMFPQIAAQMEHGVLLERELHVAIGESEFADLMEEAGRLFPEVELGSYPKMGAGTWRCSLVIKSHDAEQMDQAFDWLESALKERTATLKGSR